MSKLRQFFTGFQRGMKEFAYSVNAIINTILLSLAYFLGIGITALIAKIVKKDFLKIKLSEIDTYWADLSLKRKSREDYYRQF